MTPDVALRALEGAVILLVLGAFAYGPWQWLWIDWARQRMFDRRDEIFDLALSGKIDFSSSEYREIRASINSMIRFAHSLTWIRLLSLRFFTRKAPDLSRVVRVRDSLEKVRDPETRAELNALVTDIQKTLLKLVVLRAPLLLATAILFILPPVAFAAAYIWARDAFRSSANEIVALIELEAQTFDGDYASVR